jgi:hypothetical protein
MNRTGKTSMMKKTTTTALLLGLLASTGCAASYDRTEITDASQGDLPSTITLASISITEGGLATAHVIPYNSDGHPLSGEVRSDNPKVLEVVRASDNKWAFLGVSTGTTSVTLLADGQVVGRINAEVRGQP